MSNLAEKQCTACRGDGEALSPPQLEEMLRDVPGWDLVVLDESPAIMRKYKFRNFAQALEWANKVGAVAEREKHHPDIKLGWGYAEVTLYTHAIKGLHENDFILAAKINELS